VRTIVALAMRYLVMAVTSYGVSTFQELPRVRSWLDPWWLAGAASLALLGWRTLWALRQRRAEAAYWAWAAASFVPICQIFPFDFAIADRYLYMILPGLLGGSLLAGEVLWQRDPVERTGREAPPQALLRRTVPAQFALGVMLMVALAFGVRSAQRAALWRSAGLLNADAVTNFPDGRQAHLTRAREASRAGDVAAAAASLRRANERGYDYLQVLLQEPLFAEHRSHPAMDLVFRDLAQTWIERIAHEEHPNQGELNMLALAHETRGEYPEAVSALERALEVGGFEDELVRMRLAKVRADMVRTTRNASPRPADSQ
jgi:tetratricopeptide (TPR) repeat protein